MNAPLEKALLERAAEDWVYFAEVWSSVKRHAPMLDDTLLRDHTVGLAEDLAKRGLWCAGDLLEAGFVPWAVTPEEASERMRADLRRLNRSPTLGDVCWFDITEKGLATLKELEKTEPIQPPRRNTGSRPSSGHSSASQTQSSLGPSG